MLSLRGTIRVLSRRPYPQARRRRQTLFMSFQPGVVFFAFFSASILLAAPPEAGQIPVSIPAGVPLRLYLTRRVPKKPGALVEAKVLEPVYAFDRQVIPAGAV